MSDQNPPKKDAQAKGRVFHVDPTGVAGGPDGEGEAQAAPQRANLSTMTFTHHVLSLNHLALVHLGEGEGEGQLDLVMAAHVIDTLAMLKEKTIGNLDADESRLLDTLLYELRVKYVKKAGK